MAFGVCVCAVCIGLGLLGDFLQDFLCGSSVFIGVDPRECECVFCRPFPCSVFVDVWVGYDCDTMLVSVRFFPRHGFCLSWFREYFAPCYCDCAKGVCSGFLQIGSVVVNGVWGGVLGCIRSVWF